MGKRKSKHDGKHSDRSVSSCVKQSGSSDVGITNWSPSVITLPARNSEPIHYASLLDPRLHGSNTWSIKSPSGNLLGPKGFFNHPSRPLSLRERRERVMASLVKAEVESPMAEAHTPDSPMTLESDAKKRRKWTCFG